jgi:hypothetical protein
MVGVCCTDLSRRFSQSGGHYPTSAQSCPQSGVLTRGLFLGWRVLAAGLSAQICARAKLAAWNPCHGELSAFGLIEIKARPQTIPLDGIDEPDGVRSMPTETIVIAIIVAAFGVFAGALYWGDLQSREPGNVGRSPKQ